VHYHFYRDPFAVLAGIASQTSRISLGTAVTNPFEKHPISVAMSASTIKEMIGAKRSIILGLGRGVGHILGSQMGIPYSDSLRKLEDSTIVIRDFLAGNEVNFKGASLEIRQVTSGIARPQEDRIPIYLAAMGEKALKLAAKVADGVVLNYCTPASYVSNVVSRLKSYRAGNLNGFGISSLLWVIPEETKSSISFAKRTIADLLSFPGFGETLLPFIDEDQDLLDSIRKFYFLPEKRNDLESAAGLLSERVIRSVAILGSRNAKSRLMEYEEAGLDHPILVPLGEDSQLDRTIEVYSKVKMPE
jgi:alkanesulfonate monooxygenase SsuD/methylene tetrahydromethanopterin reductase-like flavin-dependent oxidoreductase (luciferase family)